MSSNGSITARAVSDADDRLISAEEPLAGLQLGCGGELPGVIAVPALLDIVGKARRFQMKLARTIHAQQDAQKITAWIEVMPRSDGEPGCDILLRGWRAEPVSAEQVEETDRRHLEIDRELAELAARLDGCQRILAVEAEAPDLADLVSAMRDGIGKPWTDFVSLAGDAHHQPMHWRLLDEARLGVAGSARNWRARLIPYEVPGGAPSGFELLLTADQPLPQTAATTFAPEPAEKGAILAQTGLVGREMAPVLRQPIARIIANAETIRTRLAGPLAEEYANYAADIAAAGEHLLALLDDLADLEVVESEGFSTASDHIDLADVARQAAGILSVRAQEKAITVDAPKLGESLPAIAEFRRVLQILLNLIGNAIRYSPPDSQIWIRLESENDLARMVVADQGPGLSAEDQARVFEKFERLGRSGDGGSGLGLYISRRLARAMGGDLTVESAPGQGARFILELQADPDAPLARQLPRIPGSRSAPPDKKPDED